MSDFLRYIEQRAALFTGLAAIVTILVTVVAFWVQLRRKRNEFQATIDDLQTKLSGKTDEAAMWRERANQAHQDLERSATDTAAQHTEFDQARQLDMLIKEQLNGELERVHQQLDLCQQQITREKNLVHRMLKLEGQLWEQKASAKTPRFIPLLDRRAPVLSILNLKGGVGKTTLTAHLAAAFAAKGYRVLLLDLDLQGTLSSLLLGASAVADQAKANRLLQHYLGEASHKRAPSLLHYVQPIFAGGLSGIVPTSDKLAYAEMNLTMTWLLRLAKKDTRFLLRRALHHPKIASQYDIVLMDCPPLINTCCLNALTASDYVLIPVNPSKMVAERVPQLLRGVKNLSLRVNPHLQVAGVVMNRAFRGDSFTAEEEKLWAQMMVQGQDQLGMPLHGFKALIPTTKEIRQSEEDEVFTVPEPGSQLFKVFRKLAGELESRLPSECRRGQLTLEK